MEKIDFLKYIFKKIGGQYFPFYKEAKNNYVYLKNLLPSFMQKKFYEKKYNKRLVIASMGWYDAKTEGIYAKALEIAGYEPYVVTFYNPYISNIFKLFGIHNIFYWEDFFIKFPWKKFQIKAKKIVEQNDEKTILNIQESGVHIGRYAASTVMRKLRKASFSFKDIDERKIFINELAKSLLALEVSKELFKKIQPGLILVNDRGYTPIGQLFELALNLEIPVIQRVGSHKSGYEILKRYNYPGQTLLHPHSLSKETWEYVKNISWTKELWENLYSELKTTYATGDWFSEVGTQFNKKIYDKKELLEKLNLTKNKKIVGVFPHIFWDGTFFWGENLFKDYHDWFVNVLKIAAKNTNLYWIIKIHPANIVKAKRDNYKGEPGELKAVYETLGSLPSHIRLIPPDTDINTFSLYQILDYCLTVRGTVGIECAALGINVLTAGTGRYDRLGFTYDFDTKEDYIACLEELHNLPPMEETAIELARKFAYGVFVLRPIHLDCLEHGYNKDEKATMKFKPLFKTKKEFEQSKFVKGLNKFVNSGKEDYLNLEGLNFVRYCRVDR